MEIPKFLVGDNTECQDSVFIIHTESPLTTGYRRCEVVR